MTHSKMITTRRRKQKATKRLARAATQAKKLKQQSVKASSAQPPAKAPF